MVTVTKSVLFFVLGLTSFTVYGQSSRTDYQAELKKMTGPKLSLLTYKHKFSPQGLTGYCQIGYKKLLALAEDPHLTPKAREEKEIPLLKKETDKRCAPAYYEYVDINTELRARIKAGQEIHPTLQTIPPVKKVN